MPTVFAVMPNGNEFQAFGTTKWRQFDDRYPFDGRPMGHDWEMPEVYVENPLRGKPDIWPMTGTAYAYEQRAVDALRDVVTPVGELLPLIWEGRELSVLNVTYVEDCFDRENGVTDEEYPSLIEEYAFDLSRLKHSLFKIPETAAGQLLAVEGLWSPDREFKAIVEQHKLKGIWFRQLWPEPEDEE